MEVQVSASSCDERTTKDAKNRPVGEEVPVKEKICQSKSIVIAKFVINAMCAANLFERVVL